MKRSQGGFTMVEITVTVVIAALFIVLLTQMLTSTVAQQQSVERYAKMSNIAQANLDKYQTTDSLVNSANVAYPIDNDNCSLHRTASSAFVLLNDSSPNKEQIPAGNYGTVEQRVVVYSPHYTSAAGACINDGHAPTVVSTVEYGQPPNRETITLSAKAR